MKYLFLLLFSSSFIIMNAQDEKSPAQLKEDAAAIYKNTEITIDEQVFDYRILKHYTEAELRSLPVVKRKQIHFIYTESFNVEK